MASAISELYPVGRVVWYKYKEWPWWPSKVIPPEEEGEKEAIAIKCFKTEDEYSLIESTKSHNLLKSFVHDGVEDFIIKAKKSCYKKKSVYADYCEALQLAVEYMREQTGDPNFSLGIDPYADVSTLSQKKATANQSRTCTPHTSSQAKRSSIHSSTSGEAAKDRPKSTTSASSKSKKGRNGCIIDTAANSPLLADPPELSSKDKMLESGKRKRSRDPLCIEGDERVLTEAKKQKTISGEADHLSQEKGEETGGERRKNIVPMKLNFNDEEIVDKEGSPHSIKEAPSDSQKIPPCNSSPVSKAEHRPSSPCGGSLSNGLTSELPVLDNVEVTKGESTALVGGDGRDEEQRHKEAERGEVGGLPCSSKRSEDDESDIMSTEIGGGFSDSDDDDDDSMPTFSCKIEEDLKLRQLKPNSIIWVKHSTKFPFWPALVTNVEKKRRTGGKVCIARVFFFGYNEKHTIPVRNKKRIAPFATKRSEEFMEEGRRSEYKEEFEQAVDEAKTCMEYRLKSDESTSTPRKLFDQVAKLRPKEYTKRRHECPMRSSSKVDVGSADKGDEEASEAGSDQDEFLTGLHRLPFSIDNDEEVNPDLDDSDNEEEDPVYSYDRVMKEVADLRTALMDITQGKLASEFHRKMLEGSKKERSQLKLAPKAGPIAKWSTSKRTNLIEKLAKISEEASDGKLTISYAYDVLLPEFAMRVMMKFENLSESEALLRLDHKVNID